MTRRTGALTDAGTSSPHWPDCAEVTMAERSSAQRQRMRQQIARAKPACHICGQPIDYTLPHLDPKSFVIDHVIPLAKGGTDTLDNVKAAHRDCNSAKRARLVAPIVRRSGSLD